MCEICKICSVFSPSEGGASDISSQAHAAAQQPLPEEHRQKKNQGDRVVLISPEDQVSGRHFLLYTFAPGDKVGFRWMTADLSFRVVARIRWQEMERSCDGQLS